MATTPPSPARESEAAGAFESLTTCRPNCSRLVRQFGDKGDTSKNKVLVWLMSRICLLDYPDVSANSIVMAALEAAIQENIPHFSLTAGWPGQARP